MELLKGSRSYICAITSSFVENVQVIVTEIINTGRLQTTSLMPCGRWHERDSVISTRGRIAKPTRTVQTNCASMVTEAESDRRVDSGS